MGIVFITLPGVEQRAFANALHKATGRGVELVLIKKPKARTLAGRLRRILEVIMAPGLLQELWFGALLRLSPKTRRALKYFRETSFGTSSSYEPKTLEVEDVNSAEIESILKELAPEVLVVWCSAILRPHILATAKKVINFHTGILPQYRGAVANQHATLRRDAGHIGSTIHYMTQGVDRGDIIAQVHADTTKPPKEMFRELNNKSLSLFIEIAKKILAGEEVPGHMQDQSEGEFFRLRDWTNRLRWKVGRQLLRWERTGKF